jgi:predicted enzyme related to lactoylglutathione lyase
MLVYLNASPLLQTVLDKIVQARRKIPAGHIAIFLDTEGNTLALHILK